MYPTDSTPGSAFRRSMKAYWNLDIEARSFRSGRLAAIWNVKMFLGVVARVTC
jgi:hypothetical protein